MEDCCIGFLKNAFLKIFISGPSTTSVNNNNIRPRHKMLFSASQIHPMTSTFPVSRHSHKTTLPLASLQCHGGVLRQVDEPEPCWSLKKLYGFHGCCENHGCSFAGRQIRATGTDLSQEFPLILDSEVYYT